MNKEDVKEQEAQASETQEEVTTGAETTEETETQSDIDYKKELEVVRTELEKKTKQVGQAEHVIEKLKAEGSTVNAENIEEMVNRLVDEKVNKLTEQVRGDAIQGLIEQYSSNSDEAALIKHHLENSIKPSGDDVVDIINAKALANKARFTQQTSEIKRAQSESEADKASTAGEKQSKAPESKLSAEDLKIMRAYGLSKEDLEKGAR